MALDRTSTLAGRLAGRGFGDPRRAAAVVETWLEHHEEDAVIRVMDQVMAADDPDLALAALVRLGEEDPAFLDEVLASPAFARRVVRVLGGSVALGQHVAAHPDALAELRTEPVPRSAADLRAELLRAVGADPQAVSPLARAGAADDLRLAYRRALLRIGVAGAAMVVVLVALRMGPWDWRALHGAMRWLWLALVIAAGAGTYVVALLALGWRPRELRHSD